MEFSAGTPYAAHKGEATAFPEVVPWICDALGGQFRIVTGDAGSR